VNKKQKNNKLLL